MLPHLSLRSLLVVLLAFQPALAAAPVSASHEPFDVRLHLRDPEIHLGELLPIKLRLENTSNETRSPVAVFTLVDEQGIRISFDRIVRTIPAGATEILKTRAPVAHWYASPGSFAIDVELNGEVVDSAPFAVTRATTRIPRFLDVTDTVGLATETRTFDCPTWTAGAGWGDVDGDDDLDLFLPRDGLPSQLFINHDGSFVDEASVRGVGGTATSLGAALADYDNDDDLDIYVTNNGPSFFYENDGSGSFTERAEVAGVAQAGPSQSASWGDYDDDGLVDLYVARHVDCSTRPGISQPDSLFHNEGDGTFTDQTELLSDGSTSGAGFQGLWFDYDLDGDADLLLGNDWYGSKPEPNVMWRNDGPADDGRWRFTDVSSTASMGVVMNSMGLAPGDYDRDLDIDVAISNIYDPNLFMNTGAGGFREQHEEWGLVMPAESYGARPVTWGVVSGDLNLDGWEDLYFPAGGLDPVGQANYMFVNNGTGSFLDFSAPSGAADPRISRGVAVADYDEDGRLDLFVINQEGSPRLYRNVTPTKRSRWLAVSLNGSSSNRGGCGARLVLVTEQAKLMREVYCGGTGLGSTHDPSVHFGLGRRNPIRRLLIHWPSGTRQIVRGLSANTRMEVVEG